MRSRILYSADRSRVGMVVAISAILMLSTFVALLNSASQNVGGVQDEPHVISVGTVLEPDDFNPFAMTTGISYTVLWITHDFLYTAGPDMGPYGQLAYDHSISEDGLVWTYYLHEDSYWHDNETVTAEDVEFTFNMIMRNEKDCALLGGYLANVTKVEATGEYTVQITTDVKKATMLSINIPILPEHLWSAVEEAGKIKSVDMWDPNYFPDGPVGSGPLILDEYSKAQDFIRLLKFEKYNKFEEYNFRPVNVDEVLFKIYNLEDTMVTALKSGLIDVAMGIPPTHWDSTIEDDNIEGQDINVLDMCDFGFNCASEELRTSLNDRGQRNFPKASENIDAANMSIRKAVAMSINKTQILDEIMKGHADMGDSMVPTATPFWHYYVPEEDVFPFDIAAANELLNNSGYGQFDDDGVRMNETSGKRLDFDFYYISQTLVDQLAAEKITVWLEQIGINAPPIGVPEGNLYTMWFGLEYDMFIWNWQPDPDPSFILSVLTTDEIPEESTDITAWSDVYYSNPVYDQLYLDQNAETNITKRQEIVHQMQRIAYLDCPYVILYYPHDLIAYRTDKYTNYPDMTANPGMAPDWIWFYFEVFPAGANIPPSADAGPDRTCVLNQTLEFTGEASDPNDPFDTLEWSWTFEDAGEEYTKTGRTVNYTFENLGEVVVTLTVTDPDGASDSDSLVVTVTEQDPNSGWLKGYVLTPDDDPVVGAEVKADTFIQESGTTGLYEMSLVAGNYTVTVEKDGYSNDTDEVTIVANETVWLNFTLTATAGSIKGYVYDLETDDPISDATVTIGVGKEFFSTETGYFEFLNLDSGTYNVTASKSGYDSNTTNATVVAGETTDIVIYLELKESSGGLSTTAMAIIGVILVIIAAATVAMLMERRKKGPSSSEDEPFQQETDSQSDDK
ncbi:MAG: carboxypeptidase regulatory-like domain-containing protein [Methanobacteriota archaeon]|nr:MAG: carboxypeptidase regulatory-like domain-containing protein [Euryarchaeota archaeon]